MTVTILAGRSARKAASSLGDLQSTFHWAVSFFRVSAFLIFVYPQSVWEAFLQGEDCVTNGKTHTTGTEQLSFGNPTESAERGKGLCFLTGW